ncbi:MAG TPA: hypothetical protein VFA90_02335 [Terriglobales bacterium]|nr:hypothetical protein [Terriglobales bacterium]
MFVTLYKTDKPTDFANGEYYQVHLDEVVQNGKLLFVVREKHGWWDDQQKKNANMTTTLSPKEGVSFDEAEKLYDQQLKHRAAGGFVHCLYFDPLNNPPFAYRRITP